MGSGGTVRLQALDQRWLSGRPDASPAVRLTAEPAESGLLPWAPSSSLGSQPLLPATLRSPSAREERWFRFSAVTRSHPVVHPLQSGLGYGEPDTTCSGWESPRAACPRRAFAPPSAPRCHSSPAGHCPRSYHLFPESRQFRTDVRQQTTNRESI